MTIAEAKRSKDDVLYTRLMAWRGISEGDGTSGGYAQFQTCDKCKRTTDDDGKPVYCRGFVSEAMWCFECFLAYGDPPRRAPVERKPGGNNSEVERTEGQLTVVARIMEMRGEGMGYPKIAALLNEAGVPTFGRPGAKWHGPTVRNIVLKQNGQS
jgi:hypothetical protein